jgi:hypothetical protein
MTNVLTLNLEAMDVFGTVQIAEPFPIARNKMIGGRIRDIGENENDFMIASASWIFLIRHS